MPILSSLKKHKWELRDFQELFYKPSTQYLCDKAILKAHRVYVYINIYAERVIYIYRELEEERKMTISSTIQTLLDAL